MNPVEENIIKRKFDYDIIKEKSIVQTRGKDVEYDINFLITVRGRREFAKPMYESFKKAADNSSLKICYTIIEHSNTPEHSKFCKDVGVNYIWVPSQGEEYFNKCLSYNMGVLFSHKAKFYLFHDIDILVQSDFFNLLMENVKNKNAKAIQCFTKRRVLYCDPRVTVGLINKDIDVDDIDLKTEGVNPPKFLGAPGGSIMVERDLFFKVGGYDAELFLAYSPEDAFFWDKLSVFETVYSSDNPDVEVFHMYHEPQWSKNSFLNEMQEMYDYFKRMSEEEKIKTIEIKEDIIKKYR